MKLFCLQISGSSCNNLLSINNKVKEKQCIVFSQKRVDYLQDNKVKREEGGKTRQPQVKLLKKSLAPTLAAVFLVLSPVSVSSGQTIIDIQRGATLFRQTCIGCHDAGGNIIQPGSTLYTKDLQRNGVDTEEEIYRVTYYGKGRMPGFGKECMPRGQCTFGARLEDEDIKILAEFVKLQADKGWPSIEE